jgi:hypothetical protein
MRKDEVRSINDAFAYVLDCNLATVEHMLSLRKAPSIRELRRQCSIAFDAYLWAKQFDVNLVGTRAANSEFMGKVEWFAKLE